MELKKHIPITMGDITGQVFGGPFKHYKNTRRLVGVKMAAEIDHPHSFKVDTHDFSVPSQKDMQDGILFAVKSLASGNDVYAGCMGGIGRTGLFMACMAKTMAAYQEVEDPLVPTLGGLDPVSFVRYHYLSHAVETNGQRAFVDEFDPAPIVQWVVDFHKKKEIVVEVEVETVRIETRVETVERIVYLGPVSWFLHSTAQLWKR